MTALFATKPFRTFIVALVACVVVFAFAVAEINIHFNAVDSAVASNSAVGDTVTQTLMVITGAVGVVALLTLIVSGIVVVVRLAQRH